MRGGTLASWQGSEGLDANARFSAGGGMSWGQRTCMECGVTFDAQYPAQVCCSKPCKARRKLKLSTARKQSTYARRIEEIARLRENVAVAARKSDKLRKTLEKIAGRKRFLNQRCAELVEQVSNQGAEIIALRSKLANAEALLQTADEITVRLHEEKGALKKELAAAQAQPTTAKKPTAKTTLDEMLKRAKTKVREELVMHECKRMNVRGTSLPCGKRVECFEVTRCEHVPAGMRLEL